MTATTITADASRPRSGRMLWSAVAFVLGGAVGVATTVALDSDGTSAATPRVAQPDAAVAASEAAERGPISADSAERRAVADANRAQAPVSADSAERRAAAAADDGAHTCASSPSSADALDHCIASG